VLIAIGLLAGVAGCAGAAPATPGMDAVADEAPVPTPSPSPVVVPYDGTFDPGQYGTGDPERDMALISGEFVTGIEAVRAYAPGAYPDVYTGVGGGVPGDPDVLRIILTRLDPAIEADLLAVSALPAEKVRFEQGALSEKDGLALQNRITADASAGALDSIELASWGPARDGLIDVQIVGHDPAQIQQLWDRYGPGIRIVTDASIAVAGDAPACAADSLDPGSTGC
jgi:hypothetical protein